MVMNLMMMNLMMMIMNPILMITMESYSGLLPVASFFMVVLDYSEYTYCTYLFWIFGQAGEFAIKISTFCGVLSYKLIMWRELWSLHLFFLSAFRFPLVVYEKIVYFLKEARTFYVRTQSYPLIIYIYISIYISIIKAQMLHSKCWTIKIFLTYW